MLCPTFVAARIPADKPTPIPAAPVLSVIAPFEPTRFSRILHSDSRQLGFVDVAGRTYRLMRVVVRHLELHHHSDSPPGFPTALPLRIGA
jgi:hypothetical protein